MQPMVDKSVYCSDIVFSARDRPLVEKMAYSPINYKKIWLDSFPSQTVDQNTGEVTSLMKCTLNRFPSERESADLSVGFFTLFAVVFLVHMRIVARIRG